jgi:hypothetical protein
MDAMVPYSKRSPVPALGHGDGDLHRALWFSAWSVCLHAGDAITLRSVCCRSAVFTQNNLQIAKGGDMESAGGDSAQCGVLRLFLDLDGFPRFGTILLFPIFPELSLASM